MEGLSMGDCQWCTAFVLFSQKRRQANRLANELFDSAKQPVCSVQVLDGRNIKCNIAKYPRGGGTGFRGGGRGGRGDFRGRGRCVIWQLCD